jgi:hypothetical protein
LIPNLNCMVVRSRPEDAQRQLLNFIVSAALKRLHVDDRASIVEKVATEVSHGASPREVQAGAQRVSQPPEPYQREAGDTYHMAMAIAPYNCEIASKRDPARGGTHVIDYSGKYISRAGSRFARNVTAVTFKTFLLTRSLRWAASGRGSMFGAYSHRRTLQWHLRAGGGAVL